jgi:hypothetical protein
MIVREILEITPEMRKLALFLFYGYREARKLEY